MAVLAIFTGNISKAQYESLRSEVGWEQHRPDGGVVHAAAFDDADRIHAADVWASPDAMNAFVETKLMPAFQKLGIEPPEVSVYPVHNLNAYGAVDEYKI